MNWYHERNWRPLLGAAVIGLVVFGLSLQVAPADSGGNLASAENAASVDRSTGGVNTSLDTHKREPLSAPLQPAAAERQRSQDADIVEAVETRVHFVKIIASSPVSSAGGAAAA
ncbi:MAG: hypothetical protein IIC02_05110, partial [Planctomycetes bacterium]|nr:hypothetical protein [Planctomycetota bacterium]